MMASTDDSTLDDEEDVEPITGEIANDDGDDDHVTPDEEEFDNTDESITVETQDNDAPSGAEESGVEEESVENIEENDVSDDEAIPYDDDDDDADDNYQEADDDDDDDDDEDVENKDEKDDKESKAASAVLLDYELIDIKKRFDARVEEKDGHFVIKPTQKRKEVSIRSRKYCLVIAGASARCFGSRSI